MKNTIGIKNGGSEMKIIGLFKNVVGENRMKKLLLLFVMAFSCILTVCAQGAKTDKKEIGSSILIAYFSRAGNIDLSGEVDATSSASVNLRNGK
ncbi:MAG: hypothetical protein LBG45_01385 [Dysgonamonadaceae bacterium]|nr:hypothetical protein [Dysgonamonadaceae bacterium]